jgi:hypothetical protein
MRIEQTSQWLDFLSAGLASSAASEPGKPTEVWPGIAVGALSLEQVREYRNNGGKACRLDGHEFVVELPMTTSDAARCIESLASASTSAEFDGGFLRVRYRPDASGWMRSRLYTFGTAPTSHHHDPIDVVALDVRPEPIDMYRRLRAEHGLR